MTEETLASCHKKRGVFKGKLTRITSKVDKLEKTDPDELISAIIASHLASVDQHLVSFISTHDYIQDQFEAEVVKGDEEDAREEAEELADDITRRLNRLYLVSTTYPQLQTLQNALALINPTEVDRHTGSQLQGYMVNHTNILAQAGNAIIKVKALKELNDEVTKQLHATTRAVSESMPDADVARRASRSSSSESVTDERRSPHQGSRRLPKIEIPIFTGDVLEWEQFWGTFKRNVHDNKDLHEDEKIVYLQ